MRQRRPWDKGSRASVAETWLGLEGTVRNAGVSLKKGQRQRTQMYYGYAFESYCTSDSPNRSTPNGWSGDVDTNVQWCSVVKTKLGNTRIIIGGGVDCIRGKEHRKKHR